jgi:hypothetical protein
VPQIVRDDEAAARAAYSRWRQSNNLARHDHVLVERVGCTETMIAVGDHDFTVRRVAHEKER